MEIINVEIGNDQKIPVTINPKDHLGNPAPIFGTPLWSVVSGPATFDSQPPGTTATLISQDIVDPDPALNITIFQVVADVNAERTQSITAQVKLTVVQAMAETLNPTAGTPVYK